MSHFIFAEGDDEPEVQEVVEVQGIPIHLEYLEGDERSGVSPDGEEWVKEMGVDYGFVPDTKGLDEEPLDVYLGDDHDAEEVYAVTQLDEAGDLDEIKYMVGFEDPAEALEAYLEHGPEWGFGGLTQLSLDEFQDIIDNGGGVSKVEAARVARGWYGGFSLPAYADTQPGIREAFTRFISSVRASQIP